MKRLFYYPHALRGAFLLMGILWGCLSASAGEDYYYDFEVNGIYYQFISGKSDEVAVSYRNYETGKYGGNYTDYSGYINIPSTVTYNSVTYKVTAVTSHAFDECSSVTSVELPNTITSIGAYAFADCTSLLSINLPNSLTTIGAGAFDGCINLYTLNIPNGVLSIGENAFLATGWYNSQPDGLVYAGNIAYKYKGTMPDGTELTLRDNTKGLSSGVFRNCKGLKSIIVSKSVKTIDSYAFYGCSGLISVGIPSSVTSIGQYAFSGCSGLTSVHITDLAAWCKIAFSYASNPLSYAHHLYINDDEVKDMVIPNSVTSIGYQTFYGCSGLTSVSIPSSVTSIGNDAFYGCSGLTTVSISGSVTSIGSSAFYGCSGLTAVSIPNSVTSIGSSAFYGCSGLITVSIPNSVTSIESSAFENCSSLTSVSVPGSVASINNRTFYNCGSLTTVILHNNVTTIGSSAFYNCKGLVSIIIPNNVTSIGNNAFYGCSSLTSVNIPSNVTSIGRWAFSSCGGLSHIYCHVENVPKLEDDIFYGTNIENATLHVPASALESYKSTYPWSYFGSIVSIGGKCATPTIAFVNGKVKVDCATEGAKCVTSITMAGTQISQEKEMDISTAFTVSTYAMAEGRENSEIVTATFGLPKIAGDLNEDGHIDISDVTTLVNIILGK